MLQGAGPQAQRNREIPRRPLDLERMAQVVDVQPLSQPFPEPLYFT